MMGKSCALVIGASGGVGEALVRQLHYSGSYEKIHAVSRSLPASPISGVVYTNLSSENEEELEQYTKGLMSQGCQFSLVVCCIGVLHSKSEPILSPEKRIEDINASNMGYYFMTNTIIPSLWLKNVERLLKGPKHAKLVFLSARVGSLTDNHLGGWYGYRASKSALNMIIKCAQIEFQRRAKNICLVSYHPGTVDTHLSKPYQSNVPKEKLFSAEFTVSQLLTHIASLRAEQGPHYIDWRGLPIPW